jgi:hypothetical protein
MCQGHIPVCVLVGTNHIATERRRIVEMGTQKGKQKLLLALRDLKRNLEKMNINQFNSNTVDVIYFAA